MPNTPDIAVDKLDGVKAIADYLGMTRRRAQYFIDSGKIPVGRMGKRIFASKTTLQSQWQKLTGGNSEVAP